MTGLEKLKVEDWQLPEAMKPWKEQGYKAFALSTWGGYEGRA